MIASAIRHDILDFLVRSSDSVLGETRVEARHTVSIPTVLAVLAPAAIIQTCLPQFEFGEDTIIGSVI